MIIPHKTRLKLARTSPAGLASLVFGESWKPYKHLLRLNEALKRVTTGQLKRLLISMPPQHGKSQIISRCFPAYYLGNNPTRKAILTSYSDDLIKLASQTNRDIIGHYGQALWGVGVRRDQRNVKHWATTDGGYLRAAPIFGGINGWPSDLIVFDDPYKDAEQGASRTYQKKVQEVYTSAVETRLSRNGSIVIVQTRWDDMDLIGWLQSIDGDSWEVINLPAFNESGEVLCPQLHDEEKLRRLEKILGPYKWNALYMGKPTKPIGRQWGSDKFPSSSMDIPFPTDCELITGALDPSLGKSKSSDWQFSTILGTRGDDLYYVDALAQRTPNAEEMCINIAQWISAMPMSSQPHLFAVENLAAEKDKESNKEFDLLAKELARQLNIRGCRTVVLLIRPDGEKTMRIRRLDGMISHNLIRYASGHGTMQLVDQCKQFPDHKSHDDGPDSLEMSKRTHDRWFAKIVAHMKNHGKMSVEQAIIQLTGNF